MRWSHSNRSWYNRCPAGWKYIYGGESRGAQTASPEGVFGTTVHELIADLLRWRLISGKKSIDEVRSFLDEHVDDFITDDSGNVISSKLEASWMVENSAKIIGNVASSLVEADEYGIEKELWFDHKWDRCSKEESMVGGILDCWWIKDNKVVIVDWKSGKRWNSDQLAEYALYAWMVTGIEPVETRYIWLALNEVTTEVYSKQSLLDVKENLETEIAKISKATVYPAIPGYHCRWCAKPNCLERKL